MAKILFFGDVFGKPGRAALKAAVAEFRDTYKPDVIIANVENLTHGKGVTQNALNDIKDLGIDAYTSGNHVFDKGQLSIDSFETHPELIRPANYQTLNEQGSPVPGHGFYRFAKNGQQYLVINLGGTVFFERQYPGTMGNPFFMLDKLLEQEAQKGDIIIVDIHAEATSEKQAMGWYADGRVAMVVGTHTHVPTADSRILPAGTGFCTDVGFCGPLDSVIGVTPQNVINTFLEKDKFHFEVAESATAVANAILVETEGGLAVKIEKLLNVISI